MTKQHKGVYLESMFRKILILLLVALLAAPVFAKPVLKVGSPPPSFSLPNLEEKTIALDTYLGKKIVLLSFFASWSKSCQEEIAFLEGLHEQYESKGIKVIGVSYDRKAMELASFVTLNEIELEVLHDQKLKTLKDYRILILPTLYVIDKQGKIKSIYVDFDQNVEKAVSQEIKQLLAPPKK